MTALTYKSKSLQLHGNMHVHANPRMTLSRSDYALEGNFKNGKQKLVKMILYIFDGGQVVDSEVD